MIAPKSWLSEFVSLSGISDDQFAREMTFAGNKVESVQKINGKVVYEFEITSNRPDTLSIIGLAREAAAVFDRNLKLPKIPAKRNLKKRPISLTLRDKKICPIFSIVEIEKVKIRPSSKLVQKRLELSGIRPINNVVDITNYVMLETGQPMHAFDANKLSGPLAMRAAKAKERIVTIDHKERSLSGGEYIIEDQKKLVHLVGLMGGLNSEVSENTTRICLHVPIYDPSKIRRASKRLRLRTEGSTRFEKKLDLTQTESVALRAIELIEKETGGKQATAIVTRVNEKWVAPIITLAQEKVSSLVGRSFTKEEIEIYLSKVGTKKTSKGFQPPPWRRDIAITVDLVEEVTRLYGYNKFQRTLPKGEIPINSDALLPNWKRIVAERCAALGYTETYSSTLIGKNLINELGFHSPKQHLKVLHPMSEDYEYMRTGVLETLVPFLKQNLVYSDNINIFELGTVFAPIPEKPSDLPNQPLELGLISTTSSFAEFKGDIESIAKALGVSFDLQPLISKTENQEPILSRFIDIRLGEKMVGFMGQIHPRILGGRQNLVLAASLNLTTIIPLANNIAKYPKMSNYPPIIEDLTLERPTGKLLEEALSIIKNASPLITNVEYVGEYQGFVTLRLTFQSFTNSLAQEEVNHVKIPMLKQLGLLGWKLKSQTQ